MTSVQTRTPSSAQLPLVQPTPTPRTDPSAAQSASELALVETARASALDPMSASGAQLAMVRDLEKAHAVGTAGAREKSWRRMTSGEAALVQKVFGDSIDPGRVKIYNRKFMPFQTDYTVMTPFGSVYYPPGVYEEDFSKGSVWDKWLFLHEMGHVWQHQSGHLVALEAGVLHLMWWKDPYVYVPLKPGKDLARYNLEQQGSIIADYAVGRLRESREQYEDTLEKFLDDPNYHRRELKIRRAESRARRHNGRFAHRRPRTINVPASRPVRETIQIGDMRKALEAMAGADRPVATPQSVRKAIAEYIKSDNVITSREMADIYMRAKVSGMEPSEIKALMNQLDEKSKELDAAKAAQK